MEESPAEVMSHQIKFDAPLLCFLDSVISEVFSNLNESVIP